MPKTIEEILERTYKFPQRSQEWYDLVRYTIGGSDIYDMYQNNFNFIQRKLLPFDASGVISFAWGRRCENITKLIMERFYNLKIYECSPFPGKIPELRFSPDGLAIIDGKLILFEFKSLISRKIVRNGKIIEKYIWQINTGLSVVPEIDEFVYVEAIYRMCKVNDLDFNNTNYIPVAKSQNEKLNEPIALGIIYFKLTDENADTHECEDIEKAILGNAEFIYSNPVIDGSRIPIEKNYSKNELDEWFRQIPKKGYCYFAWKLFDIYTIVEANTDERRNFIDDKKLAEIKTNIDLIKKLDVDCKTMHNFSDKIMHICANVAGYSEKVLERALLNKPVMDKSMVNDIELFSQFQTTNL